MDLKLPLLALLLFLAIGFNSCKKTNKVTADNPYGLPNASQTGANVFACRVNDSNWIVGNTYQSELASSYNQTNSRDSFWLFATGSSDISLYQIRFNIRDLIKSGSTFDLSDTAKTFASAEVVYLNCKPSNTYGDHETLISIKGNIQFTKFSGTYQVPSCCTHGNYDPNSIIAGKFNFTLVFPGCDTIQVTDGRFDINYSQY